MSMGGNREDCLTSAPHTLFSKVSLLKKKKKKKKKRKKKVHLLPPPSDPISLPYGFFWEDSRDLLCLMFNWGIRGSGVGCIRFFRS